MSITFGSTNPTQLLNSFKEAIDNHEEHRNGPRVDTWRYVAHDGHWWFTHTAQNWRDKAWLRAEVQQNKLVFTIRPINGVPLTRDTYAYYVGHLAETFIRHFSASFGTAVTTGSPGGGDTHF
jgi:hypothetical protein